MKLTINCVTRGRPELLVDTVKRTLPNIGRPNTTLMVSVDRDDEKTIAALDQLPHDRRIVISVEDREDAIGDKYGRMISRSPSDVYMAMSDYAPYVTPEFDSAVLHAAQVFPDGIGVVYNYLADNLSFSALNAVTAKLVEKMGFYYPPHFPFWFVDHWLDDIARYIDRLAFANVRADISNNVKRTTTGRRDVRFWALLFDALYLRRQECAARIITSEDFKDPEWRKQRSLAMFPYIEQRSRMINAQTRQDSGQYEPLALDGPEEIRYARIFANGQRVMREAIAEIEKARSR